MKPNQQGWLRELSFGKVLAILAVFVVALTGFLALTDPSNVVRPTKQDHPAGEMHRGPSTDEGPRNSSEDPSLPAAAAVLPQGATSSDPAAPTF